MSSLSKTEYKHSQVYKHACDRFADLVTNVQDSDSYKYSFYTIAMSRDQSDQEATVLVNIRFAFLAVFAEVPSGS